MFSHVNNNIKSGSWRLNSIKVFFFFIDEVTVRYFQLKKSVHTKHFQIEYLSLIRSQKYMSCFYMLTVTTKLVKSTKYKQVDRDWTI